MICVHAEVVRNTKTVVVKTLKIGTFREYHSEHKTPKTIKCSQNVRKSLKKFARTLKTLM